MFSVSNFLEFLRQFNRNEDSKTLNCTDHKSNGSYENEVIPGKL